MVGRSVLALILLAACGVRKAELEALADPQNPDAWEELGDRCRSSLRRDQATDAYRMAMELDPSRTHLAARMSTRPSKEARELRKAAMKTPTDDELWGDLGDLLAAEGNTLEARAAYLRAFRLDPEDAEWQRALVGLGDGGLVLDRARANLVESDDESHGDLGDILMATGAVDEACEHFRRAAELDPADEEWIGHAVECGYPTPDVGPGTTEEGMVEGVRMLSTQGYSLPEASDLEGLTRQLSQDAGLLVRLGQAHLRAGDREAAARHLWDALLVEPTSEEALQSWMAAAQKTRREGLEKLRDLFPEDDEVVGLLGDHYLDLGLRDRARDLYELAHRLDEEDPEWKAKRILLGAQP